MMKPYTRIEHTPDLVLYGLNERERRLTIRCARHLRETENEVLTRLRNRPKGKRGAHSERLRTRTAEKVIDAERGLHWTDRARILNRALQYAVAMGWYQPGGYAMALNERRSA